MTRTTADPPVNWLSRMARYVPVPQDATRVRFTRAGIRRPDVIRAAPAESYAMQALDRYAPAVHSAVKSFQNTPDNPIVALLRAAGGSDPMGVIGGPAGAAAIPGRLEQAVEEAKTIRAFHGSPHFFDKFNSAAIGTGEGAQAFGHGLYFGESEGTARYYRDVLSQGKDWRVGEHEVPDWIAQRLDNAADPIAAAREVRDDFAKRVAEAESQVAKQEGQWWNAQGNLPNLRKIHTALDGIITNGELPAVSRPGSMYEVNINSDPAHFFDWDKPLSEQHENVQKAVRALAPKRDVTSMSQSELEDVMQHIDPNGEWSASRQMDEYGERMSHAELLDAAKEMGVEEYLNAPFKDSDRGESIYKQLTAAHGGGAAWSNEAQAVVSRKLNEAGIPGIKYLDEGSRATSGGEVLGVTQAPDGWRAKVKVSNRTGVVMGGAPTDIITTSAPHPTREAAEEWARSKINAGSRNYVVFDAATINILRKYGLAGLIGGGAAALATRSRK